MTLIAAVLPAISPNNDSRKIREASRQLVSLFAQAQAQAARDGRPVGVGFSDKWTDADNDGNFDQGERTGMALEAYIISEPPEFTGFDFNSTVWISGTGTAGTYPPLPGVPLVSLTFGHGVGRQGFGSPTVGAAPDLTDQSDAIPPNVFRPGDIVEVGNERFQIALDDLDSEDGDSLPDTDIPEPPTGSSDYGYLRAQKSLTAYWLTRDNRLDVLLPQGGKPYRIRRKPMATLSASRTSAEAIQFPRGIGVDLDPTEGNAAVGIVFSPNGSMDAIYLDGDKMRSEPFFILLGRTENSNPPTGNPPGNNPPDDIDYDRYRFDGNESDDDLAQRRREVNLLNPDSRWVVITPAGRVISNENAIFDPRLTDFVNGTPADNTPAAQRQRQRNAAQSYAAQFQSEGGG